MGYSLAFQTLLEHLASMTLGNEAFKGVADTYKLTGSSSLHQDQGTSPLPKVPHSPQGHVTAEPSGTKTQEGGTSAVSATGSARYAELSRNRYEWQCCSHLFSTDLQCRC